MTSIVELFTDETIITRIKNRLPKLFHIADLECQRAGKIGMEVGSIRERIIVSLMIISLVKKMLRPQFQSQNLKLMLDYSVSQFL